MPSMVSSWWAFSSHFVPCVTLNWEYFLAVSVFMCARSPIKLASGNCGNLHIIFLLLFTFLIFVCFCFVGDTWHSVYVEVKGPVCGIGSLLFVGSRDLVRPQGLATGALCCSLPAVLVKPGALQVLTGHSLASFLFCHDTRRLWSFYLGFIRFAF